MSCSVRLNLLPHLEAQLQHTVDTHGRATSWLGFEQAKRVLPPESGLADWHPTCPLQWIMRPVIERASGFELTKLL